MKFCFSFHHIDHGLLKVWKEGYSEIIPKSDHELADYVQISYRPTDLFLLKEFSKMFVFQIVTISSLSLLTTLKKSVHRSTKLTIF